VESVNELKGVEDVYVNPEKYPSLHDIWGIKPELAEALKCKRGLEEDRDVIASDT